MSQDARLDEEQATERRARVLGLDYVDTSKISNKNIYKEILSTDQIKSLRVVPVESDKSHLLFGITTTTRQQTLSWLDSNFIEQRISKALISDTGFNEYVFKYDPPPQIVYKDIDLDRGSTPEMVGDI